MLHKFFSALLTKCFNYLRKHKLYPDELIYFQVILFLHLASGVPHPQASHHIYSSSDLLAVDSIIHSYSVKVAPPQSFLHQLAVNSQKDTKQVILPTPLPGRGPKQGVALAGMDNENTFKQA